MRRLLLLVAVIFLLAGCSGGGGGTILRMADWSTAGDNSDFNKTIDEIYQRFDDQNPGVDLQVEGTPDMQAYVTKLLLSHVAGTAPDVMRLDASSAAVFINNDVLRDLSPYIKADKDFSLDDYFSNVVDITRRGGAVYGIPVGFTPMVLYYNKDLFDAAGVPYPDGTWTYAQFLDAAKKLTKGDVYGFEFSNWMAMWILFLWNNGGDVLSPDGTRATGYLDSQQNVDAVQFIDDMVNKYHVAPTQSQTAALGVNLFATGKAAMKIVGHWEMVDYAKPASQIKIDRIGVCAPPSNLAKPVTVMYESGLAIMKNCKHPDLAWRLIKYLCGYKVQHVYNATGIEVCGLKQVAAEAGGSVATEPSEINRVVPPLLEQDFVSIVPSARPPWGAKVERFNLVEPIMQKMMDRVLYQDVSPKVALHDAAEEIDVEMTKP
ncbi:MAG TPA: sugar ABC transporter substrate-binding protein [Fimbriimonadaceae bacterium]|nr:sugar ABC transporter substrate-binding protein [Fimbriimonadaceae bacterium]